MAGREPMVRRGKKRKKKRHSPFYYFIILLTVAFVAVALTVMLFFKADTIIVEGSTRYPHDQIIRESGIEQGENILSIDKKAVSRRLCRNLPYLKSAEVKLKLLSTVVVSVTPDEPFGAVKTDGGYLIIDETMKVLDSVKDKKQVGKLPVIAGIDTQNGEIGQALAKQGAKNPVISLYNSLKSNKLDKITGIDISNQYQITIGYDNRINILVGTKSDLDDKLEMAVYIIKNKLSATDKGKLDVSDPRRAVFSANNG